MAKYLGIPLTISNGNRIPLTAQPEIFSNNTFEGTPTVNGDNFDLAPNWRLRSTAGTSSTFTSDGVSFIWTGGNSTYLRAANEATNLAIFEVGKAYEITYTINESSEDNNLRIENGDSLVQLTTKLGKNTKKFIAKQTDFTLIRNSSVLSGSVEVQSIYLKEIAATETPTYGSPELVENSEFNKGNVDWTFLGVNPPSINNTTDTLDFTNSPATAVAKTTNTILEQGKRYLATIDIESITSGGLALVYTAGTYSPTFTSAGVYNYDFVQDGSLSLASIECYSRDASTTAVVNSIKIKEVPYVMGTREFLKDGSFPPNTTAWTFGGGATLETNGAKISNESSGGSAIAVATQVFPFNLSQLTGKVFEFTYDVVATNGETLAIQQSSNVLLDTATVGVNRKVTFTWDFTFNDIRIKRHSSGLITNVTIDNVSLKELEYNYLQVSDGGFKNLIKEGDVVFNTSTSTEGVVKDVINDNVLLMSNDNFSTAGEFFNVFAANNDPRGNQIIAIDNYIMSEYDENTSNPQESSFWFAGGRNADKVTMSQLMPSTNTYFVANIIEGYIERVNAQSATASRLDIPLDDFRDHQYGELLMITDITLS